MKTTKYIRLGLKRNDFGKLLEKLCCTDQKIEIILSLNDVKAFEEGEKLLFDNEPRFNKFPDKIYDGRIRVDFGTWVAINSDPEIINFNILI